MEVISFFSYLFMVKYFRQLQKIYRKEAYYGLQNTAVRCG